MIGGPAVGSSVSVALGTGVSVGVTRTAVAVAAGPQAEFATRNARSAKVEIALGQLTMPEFYQYLAVPTLFTLH